MEESIETKVKKALESIRPFYNRQNKMSKLLKQNVQKI